MARAVSAASCPGLAPFKLVENPVRLKTPLVFKRSVPPKPPKSIDCMVNQVRLAVRKDPAAAVNVKVCVPPTVACCVKGSSTVTPLTVARPEIVALDALRAA